MLSTKNSEKQWLNLFLARQNLLFANGNSQRRIHNSENHPGLVGKKAQLYAGQGRLQCHHLFRWWLITLIWIGADQELRSLSWSLSVGWPLWLKVCVPLKVGVPIPVIKGVDDRLRCKEWSYSVTAGSKKSGFEARSSGVSSLVTWTPLVGVTRTINSRAKKGKTPPPDEWSDHLTFESEPEIEFTNSQENALFEFDLQGTPTRLLKECVLICEKQNPLLFFP